MRGEGAGPAQAQAGIRERSGWRDGRGLASRDPTCSRNCSGMGWVGVDGAWPAWRGVALRVSGRGSEGGAPGIERDIFRAGPCCEWGVALRESGRDFEGRGLKEGWAGPCGGLGAA